MKRTLLKLAGIVAVACVLVACDDPAQKLPEGADFRDPTGQNAKAAPGANPNANSPAQEKMAQDAKAFGQDMNQKYGGK